MKKIFLFLIIPILLFSMTDQYIIKNHIQKENKLYNYIINYIYITADITPTRSEISNFYHLDYTFFNNLLKESCNEVNNRCLDNGNGINFSLNNNKFLLTISNNLGSNLSGFSNKWLEFYKRNKNNNFIINGNDLKISLDQKTINFITFIENLNDNNIYVNKTSPTDTNINTWFRPIGLGKLDLMFKNENDEWLKITTLNENYNIYNLYLKNNNIDLTKLKLLDNSKINVIETDGSIASYLQKNNQWELYSNNTDNSLSNSQDNNDSNITSNINDTNIYNIACIDFNKPEGFKSNIGIIDKHITTPLTFIKTKTTYDYWNSSNYYITKSLADLKNISTNNKDIAFICSQSRLNYDTLMYLNNKWTYLINSFKELNKFYSYPNNIYVSTWDTVSLNDDKYIFEKKENSNNKVYWESINTFNDNFVFTTNSDYELTFDKDSRDVFENPTINKKYLTAFSDCAIKANCNGDTKYIHNDWKIHDLYTWIFDGNNLIDALPINNVADMYSGDNKYKGSYYYNDHIYIKSYDTNGNIIYKKKNTLEFITKKGQIVPSNYLINNIPTFPKKVLTDNNTNNDEDITASNVVFINNIIQIKDLLQLASWENKNGLEANIIGEYGKYILTLNGNNGYWENKDIKKIVTIHTRNELPIITKFNYIYLTGQIGCSLSNIQDVEQTCRYSYSGFKYKNDNRFYRWYYAETSKSVNGYIDLQQYNTIEELYESNSDIGQVLSSGSIFKKIVDINGNNCYEDFINTQNIITKKNQYIPLEYLDINNNIVDSINLPTNRTCSNIEFLGNSIIFNDRIDLLDWNNATTNQQGYLKINNTIYTANKNSNNKLFFVSEDNSEFITNEDKSVFENISFTGLNTLYLTKKIGSDFLYNNGLQLKNYQNVLKSNGVFSTNDLNLYAWYENPRIDLISQPLTDIFVIDDLNTIYNSEIPYIWYNDGNQYNLLQKDNYHNSLCYIDKSTSPYKYFLKQTGEISPYGDNLPLNKNCLNTNFYNNMLVVNNMKNIVNNWDTALNGYKVIFSDLDSNKIYTYYNDNTYKYWAKDTSLNNLTSTNIPNEVYTLNRTTIPSIDPTYTDMNIYTTSIYNEETNLNLGNQALYRFETINNIDSEIRNNINNVNNLSEYFNVNHIDLYVFDNITDIQSDNNDNVQIVPDACKLIVDGYWDYSEGNNGSTARSSYSGNGYSNWSYMSYIPNDIPLFVQNNELYFSHNYKFKYNGGSEIVPGGFVVKIDTFNNAQEIISSDLNSFYNNSYTVPNDIDNEILFNTENFYKFKYYTNCTTSSCPFKYKNIQFRNDNQVITLAQGYSTNEQDLTPIHDTSYYYGIEFQGYHFVSSLNYATTPYTNGHGAELDYFNSGNSITNFLDFSTGDDGTKPYSSFLYDFYNWDTLNVMAFIATPKDYGYSSNVILDVNNDFSALNYLWNDKTYVVQNILGSINGKLIMSIKNISNGNYYIYNHDGSQVNMIGSDTYSNIKPIGKPKNETTFKTSYGLFFECNSSTYGNELCYTDGTTIKVVDETPGTASTTFQGIVQFNDKIYFGNTSDKKIYSFDGTNINMVNDTFTYYNSNQFFYHPVVFNNKIYFQRNDECGKYVIGGSNTTTGEQWNVLHYLSD